MTDMQLDTVVVIVSYRGSLLQLADALIPRFSYFIPDTMVIINRCGKGDSHAVLPLISVFLEGNILVQYMVQALAPKPRRRRYKGPGEKGATGKKKME